MKNKIIKIIILFLMASLFFGCKRKENINDVLIEPGYYDKSLFNDLKL